MPVLHDKDKLEALLKEKGIPLNNSKARGEFYKTFFDWDYYSLRYSEGEDSIRSICKKTGLSYDVVRINLKRKLGKLNAFSTKGRSNYSFNEELLSPLKEEGAYLLGWLYSDGCITHSKINITLKPDDYGHLKYLVSLFTNKECCINNKGYAEFNYFSVDLTKLLKDKYNLLERKSFENYEIPIKEFDNKNLPYLLLGLLEGDGSISKKCLYCQLLLTEKAWKSISVCLKDIINLEEVKETTLNEHGLTSVVLKGRNYFSLLNYIYSNTCKVTPLKRKFNNFLTQLDRSSKGRTSPYRKIAVNIRDSLSNTLN